MEIGEDKLRIVVKVGTSTLTRDDGSIKLRCIDRLAMALADLRGQGHQVILVSSGAIGVGVGKLGLGKRPDELRVKQAVLTTGMHPSSSSASKVFSRCSARRGSATSSSVRRIWPTVAPYSPRNLS